MGPSYAKVIDRVDIFCRFSTMHERDRQTDRQTDGQTQTDTNRRNGNIDIKRRNRFQ